jgi:tetratricopeptide (TPR) repeat protein
MSAQYHQTEAFNEAKSQFLEGNYRVAEAILNRLILDGTRNPEVYQMLATIFYDKGQFNKAIKTFKRALEIDPAYTDASVGLSIILNDLGRYDEGKRVFEEARAILDRRKAQSDPYLNEKLASKHEELGDLYFQHQRFQEALEQFIKAKHLSTRRVELGLRLADCFYCLDKKEYALRELNQLVREFPDYLPVRNRLAQILWESDRIAEATELWESILVKDPQNLEAKKNLERARSKEEIHKNSKPQKTRPRFGFLGKELL